MVHYCVVELGLGEVREIPDELVVQELGGEDCHQGHVFAFADQLAGLLSAFCHEPLHLRRIEIAGLFECRFGEQVGDVVRWIGTEKGVADGGPVGLLGPVDEGGRDRGGRRAAEDTPALCGHWG